MFAQFNPLPNHPASSIPLPVSVDPSSAWSHFFCAHPHGLSGTLAFPHCPASAFLYWASLEGAGEEARWEGKLGVKIWKASQLDHFRWEVVQYFFSLFTYASLLRGLWWHFLLLTWGDIGEVGDPTIDAGAPCILSVPGDWSLYHPSSWCFLWVVAHMMVSKGFYFLISFLNMRNHFLAKLSN